MCPNFHCNLTVRFTFNCCSKYSCIIVKLIYSFFCNFLIGLYKAIKCKPYSEITVESGTQLKTVYICNAYCPNIYTVLLTLKATAKKVFNGLLSTFDWSFATFKRFQHIGLFFRFIQSKQICTYSHSN